MSPTEKLILKQTNDEGRLEGIRKDGKKYSVREHRLAYFMPDQWQKLVIALPTKKSKITAEMLIQTGARINEVRNVEERDIDYKRSNLRLRITKTKAKKGERKGQPRNIPMNPQFIKKLKKHFSQKKSGEKVGLLSTPAFNTAMKKALQDMGEKEWYMYSAHNIRKTHGNWLKIMGNLRIMDVDATEICLRLGHDYGTFLKDYGSAGVMDSKDIMIIKEVLGTLYQR